MGQGSLWSMCGLFKSPTTNTKTLDLRVAISGRVCIRNNSFLCVGAFFLALCVVCLI